MIRFCLPTAVLLLLLGCNNQPPPPPAPIAPVGPSYADLCKLVEVKEQEMREAEAMRDEMMATIETQRRYLNGRAATTTSVSEFEAMKAAAVQAESQAQSAIAKSRELVNMKLEAVVKAKERRDRAAP